jgi:hypothetical protein
MCVETDKLEGRIFILFSSSLTYFRQLLGYPLPQVGVAFLSKEIKDTFEFDGKTEPLLAYLEYVLQGEARQNLHLTRLPGFSHKPFEGGTVRVTPEESYLCPRLRYFGPYQRDLVSWLQGYQYTIQSGRFSHHQIKKEDPLKVPRSSLALLSTPIFTRAVLPFLADTGLNLSLPREIFASASTSDRLSSFVKKEILQRNKEKTGHPLWVSKFRFDDSEPPPRRSNGSREAVRRGTKAGSETPKAWNSSRAHRVHPYWTDNLKYVC